MLALVCRTPQERPSETKGTSRYARISDAGEHSSLKMPKKSQRGSAKGSSSSAAASAKKGKPKGKQLTAEQLYEQAQIALQYDDFDSARSALRQAVRQEPDNLEVGHWVRSREDAISVILCGQHMRPGGPMGSGYESGQPPLASLSRGAADAL